MPISEKKKITNSRYIAKCDSIQIRPPKERGGEIRAAAVAAGQSVQAYIAPKEWPAMVSPRRNPGKKGDYRGLLGRAIAY